MKLTFQIPKNYNNMLKKILSSIISVFILLLQSNFAVFAQEIKDDVTERSFKGQNLSKPAFKHAIIQDDIIQNLDKNAGKPAFNQEAIKDDTLPTYLKKEQLKKPTVENIVIIDKSPTKSVDNQDFVKPDGKYKLIDENAETVYVYVSPINLLVTKKGLYEGEKVNFKVVSDVKKNGELFIKKDTPVEAFVETVTKSSFAGDPAELVIGRLITKDINKNAVNLAGEINKKGANRALWVKPLMYIGYCVPIFGTPLLLLFFVKGGKAKIKPKNQFKLYYE